MRPIRTALTLAVVLAAPSAGEEMLLELDPARTGVAFDVEATGHDVHGVVRMESGRVRFDPATGAASGEIVISAGGAATGNGSRDKTLREEVLEVARFPTIRFVPDQFAGELPAQGSGEVVLRGTMELHGAWHPVAMPARVTVEGGRITADATFAVPYKDWGLHDPSIAFLRVAGVVSVHVHADGTL
jgi:polyisoprenoid-binding protein YceI